MEKVLIANSHEKPFVVKEKLVRIVIILVYVFIKISDKMGVLALVRWLS